MKGLRASGMLLRWADTVFRREEPEAFCSGRDWERPNVTSAAASEIGADKLPGGQELCCNSLPAARRWSQ